MKKLTIFCATLFLFGVAAGPALAQTGHHGMGHGDGKPHHGMRMQHGDCMQMAGGPDCPMCGMHGGKGMRKDMGMGMMDDPMHGMHGMMMEGKAPSFYLDMEEDLGLERQQVERLREIRREFRKDFIRRSAELKIGKLELMEAFQGDWSVEAAEEQLRQMLELRADLVVRYLKARKQAEQVLSSEQLGMVREEMER